MHRDVYNLYEMVNAYQTQLIELHSRVVDVFLPCQLLKMFGKHIQHVSNNGKFSI